MRVCVCVSSVWNQKSLCQNLSLTKESKYSEILLNKNNKCLFSQVYTSKYIPINLPVKPILGADIDLFNLKSYINKAYYINILMWNLK